MPEAKKEDGHDVLTEIEITRCPECGTEWEVVVTERTQSPAANRRREG